MKQTFNLLAEVLALPFSELFFEQDLLEERVRSVWRSSQRRSDRISELRKQIDQMGTRAARHIDLHTTFPNTSVLQNMVNYVYRAEDIVRIAEEHPELDTPRAVTDHYYTILMRRIAKTFLTTRNSRAAFKYWAGSNEAYSHGKQRIPDGAEWSGDLLGTDFGTHRIEAWHSMLQCLSESFFLSSYAACLAEAAPEADRKSACFQMLLQFGGSVQIADIPLDRVLDQGLAETHLHGAASRSFDLIWEELLQSACSERDVLSRDYRPVFTDEITREGSGERAREALIARTILAAYLRSGARSLQEFVGGHHTGTLSCGIEPRYRAPLSKAICELTRDGRPSAPFSSIVRWIRPFLQRFSTRHDDPLPHLLEIPASVYTTDIGFAERCFMTLSLLHIAQSPCDKCFAAVFLYYLRLKNYFYRCRTQDSKSKGLPYFQHFYAQSTDSGEQLPDAWMASIIYTALLDRRIIKTEFRLPPPRCSRKGMENAGRQIQRRIERELSRFIRQHIYVISVLYGDPEPSGGSLWDNTAFKQRWYTTVQKICRDKRGELKRLLEGSGVSVERVHPHRIGIVYHFIKEGERCEDRSCFIRRGGVTELDRYGAFSFGKTRFRCQAVVNAIAGVRRLSPEMSHLIVGIDAASQELPTEPWVFAPAFRLARELDLIPLSGPAGQKAKKGKTTLGITYHVGEEFHHPLSGLRHICEAVEFYKMHTGDRLGHALALGIDLEEWSSRHGLITIPRIEWMEDCLWAWKIIAQAPAVTHLAEYSKFLEAQILSCADMIYGTLNGISVETLWYAYRNKTLGYQELAGLSERWAAKHQLFEMDCAEYLDDDGFFPCAAGGKAHEYAWSEEALTLSYHCGFYKSRMSQEMIREPDAQELALIQDLQTYLRGRISKAGIILEENPSSNAAIGEMDGILSHPVCSRGGKTGPADTVLTTINTDDPSVFSANVANEHALIYFGLLHHGSSVEAALKTVDTLRQTGLDSSFISDPPAFEHLLLEYEDVLQILAGEGIV